MVWKPQSSLPLLENELSSLYLLLLTYCVSTQFLKDIVCPGYVVISLHSKYLVNCIYGNHTHVFPSFKGFYINSVHSYLTTSLLHCEPCLYKEPAAVGN